jgi:hypothetical protein
MAKMNKYASIAAILILVLSLGTVLVPAHKALAITPVYVNVNTGSNSYDGSSATYTGGTTGPKQTIAAGFIAVDTGGTVNVAAGTYYENLTFNRSFTLAGAGAASTIIDGGGTLRVIYVNGATVTISGVTIQNGHATGSAGGLTVINSSTLTVNDCVIRDNIGCLGGGVNVGDSNTLYMNRCTISGNSSPDLPSGGGYGGGGIRNGGGVNLTNCTISGNSASDDANGYGGGIYNWGTMTLTNCTVADNSASGSPGWGGGFDNTSGGTMTFMNTIVANNTATGVGGGNNGYNDSSTVTSYGYNIDSENSCGFDQFTDQTNTDPLLGPLQDNGGATPTCELLSGSPAIDAGTCTGAPTTDQRGVIRPWPWGASCDIGAYEVGPSAIPDVVGDYSIKGSIKFYDWKCNKWLVVQGGTLHITDQTKHKVAGYWEPNVALGWSDNVSVMGYVGPFFRDAKRFKIKNTPRLSLLLELGTYCIYSDDTYTAYIINGKVKMDKKTETVKSIKCTINGWGEFGGDDPNEADAPNIGQFEGKFTATPIP